MWFREKSAAAVRLPGPAEGRAIKRSKHPSLILQTESSRISKNLRVQTHVTSTKRSCTAHSSAFGPRTKPQYSNISLHGPPLRR